MHYQAAKLLRRILAVLIAVSLSICCCRTSFFVHGLSGSDTQTVARSVDSMPTCCSGSQDCDPGEQAPEDEPSEPVQGCKTCCVKGTGLKDAGATLASMDATLITFTLPVTIVQPKALPQTDAPRIESSVPWVEARSLLRMHCALIV